MAIRDFEHILPDIAPSCFIEASALVIGDVTIGEHSSVWPFAILRGDVNKITIGANTNIQDHCVLHVTHDGPYNPGGYPLIIGNNITVGHRVTLHGCTVRDNCLVGMGSTIMDGAIIHSNNLVGAGSLVTPGKELESGYLWMGSPVRRVRALTEEEIQSIEYSAQHYVRLKNRYHESQ